MALSIPGDIGDKLELSRWTGLSRGERIDIGGRLTELLDADDRRFENMALVGHGPDQDLHLLEWRDADTKAHFILIPGGTFSPGYDAAHLDTYDLHYRHIEGWRQELIARGHYLEDEDDPHHATQMFASAAPCDLRKKPPVTIAPLLMAATILPAGAPCLQGALAESDMLKRIGSNHSLVRWPQMEAILHHFRWDLPTTFEYEWAMRGGEDALFYWGNDLPDFLQEDFAEPNDDLLLEYPPPRPYQNRPEEIVRFKHVMPGSVELTRPRLWPYANRFGLAGMAAWGAWCAPSTTPDDPCPLITRGGASGCYPWQSCGEWKLLLTAAERRLSPNARYADLNALRPVIHLREDS